MRTFIAMCCISLFATGCTTTKPTVKSIDDLILERATKINLEQAGVLPNNAESESARLLGMFWQLECEEVKARKQYEIALTINRDNTDAQLLLDTLTDWMRSESNRYFIKAFQVGGIVQRIYLKKALKCDPTNEAALGALNFYLEQIPRITEIKILPTETPAQKPPFKK